MDRRVFLTSAAALAATWAGAPPIAMAATPEDARLRAILDSFWEADLDEAPQLATSFGVDTGKRAVQRGRLDDVSSAARARWVAARKARLAQLSAIDQAKLSSMGKTDLDVVQYAYRKIVEGGERFTFGEGGYYAPYSPCALSKIYGVYQSTHE